MPSSPFMSAPANRGAGFRCIGGSGQLCGKKEISGASIPDSPTIVAAARSHVRRGSCEKLCGKPIGTKRTAGATIP